MNSNDFSNLGRQIRDTVQEALDSKNFSELNQTINRTVEQALREARLHQEKVRREYEKPEYTNSEYVSSEYRKADHTKPVNQKQQVRMLLAPEVKKGTWQIVTGAVGMGMLAVPMTISLFNIWFSGISIKTGVLITVFLIVAVVFAMGVRLRKRYSLTRKCAVLAGTRGFCEVKELAERLNVSEEKMRKDIRKLIEKKMFRQAHMDSQETCLMVTESAYQSYQQAEESRREREAAEEQKRKQEGEMSPEILEMIRLGEQYIQTIREANDDIPGEVISEKLDRLETIVRRIFDSVKKHPEQKKEMDRFMDYYMPTTLKLVNTYREFDAMEVKGTNILTSMNEIENTLDTIIMAFEKLLDDLFQDTAFDVSSDISVLQTMLAREGYKEKDFK